MRLFHSVIYTRQVHCGCCGTNCGRQLMFPWPVLVDHVNLPITHATSWASKPAGCGQQRTIVRREGSQTSNIMAMLPLEEEPQQRLSLGVFRPQTRVSEWLVFFTQCRHLRHLHGENDLLIQPSFSVDGLPYRSFCGWKPFCAHQILFSYSLRLLTTLCALHHSYNPNFKVAQRAYIIYIDPYPELWHL